MKLLRLQFLIGIILCSYGALYGQDTIPVVLKLPLSGEVIISNEKEVYLKAVSRAPFVFEITGLNPLKYDYAVNHKFVTLFKESNADPSDIFSSASASGSKAVSTQNQVSKSRNRIEELTFKDSSLRFQKNIKSLDNSQKAELDKQIDVIRIQIEMEQKILDELLAMSNSQLTFFQLLFKHFSEINQSLGLTVVDANVKDADLINTKSSHHLINAATSNMRRQIEAEVSRASRLEVLDLKKLQDNINHLAASHALDLIFYNQLKVKYSFPEDKDIKTLITAIEENFKSIGDNLVKVNSLETTYKTKPIDFHGENIDYVSFKVNVVPIDKAAKKLTDLETYEYKVWAKGGFKIDFSAGLFISSLRDKIYLTSKVAATDDGGEQLYTFSEEDNGKMEYGIGSTVNLNFRNASSVSWGVGIGGYVTEGQKFRLVAGPNLIVGKMERLMFGTGLVMGEVTRLSNKVNLTDTFELGNDGAVPTVEKFVTKFYFSLTYNLTGAKKKEE